MEIFAVFVAVSVPLLLLLSAMGWGSLALKLGGFSFSQFSEAIAFKTLLGLGGIGLILLGVGTLGWFYPWALWGVLGAGLAWLRPGDFKIGRGAVKEKRADIFSVLFLTLSGFIVFVIGAKALLPPTTADELTYHLYLPKFYLLKHQVFFWIYHINSAFPLLTELLYSYGVSLGHPFAIKGVHSLFGILTALLLYGFSKRIQPSCPAWWSGALFLTVPVINHQMGLANNDLALTAFTFGSYTALFRWFEEKKPNWLILSAALSGFALGVKYLAVFSLIIQAALIVINLFSDKRRLRNYFSSLALWGGAVLLISGVWYLRSFLSTGNPIYPYLTGYFGGEGFEHPLQLEGKGFGKDIMSLFLLPWHVTFFPESFGGRGNQWGPVFLAFLPWIFWVRPEKDRLWSFIQGVLAGTTLLWFYSKQNLRFLLPALPFFCVTVCLILNEFSQRGAALRRAARLFFLVFIGIHAGIAVFQLRDDAPFLLGREDRDTYLTRRNPVYPMAKVLNRLEGKKAKVLSEEYWAYDFEGVVVRERAYRRLSHYPEVYKGREGEWYDALKAEGFTHLLAKQPAGQNEKSALAKMLDVAGFPRRKLTLVHESTYPEGGKAEIEYSLYRMETNSGS